VLVPGSCSTGDYVRLGGQVIADTTDCCSKYDTNLGSLNTDALNETLSSRRVRDTSGNLGLTREIVIRVQN